MIARVEWARSRWTRVAVVVTGVALSFALAACDPCTGVAHCEASPPYLAASGQIVDRVTGAGVDGTRIDVVRTSGITVGSDSVSAITSGGGFWRVEFDPADAGTLVVDVQVSPPEAPGYRVRGVPLATRPHGGDANLNATWVTRPYFNYAGELFRRGTIDERIQNRPVEFRITGGVRTVGAGVRDSIYSAATDVGGRVQLFPVTELLPLGTDDLIGDLTVFLDPPLGPSVIRDIHLSPSYMFFDVGRIARYAVGP
ncbi:MAG TPA: hypothetical protein VFI52_03335 [Gemmatimonadaceae bacterium]|nr:hypothetical protein [Gemmatimonadaceae bacterium]